MSTQPLKTPNPGHQNPTYGSTAPPPPPPPPPPYQRSTPLPPPLSPSPRFRFPPIRNRIRDFIRDYSLPAFVIGLVVFIVGGLYYICDGCFHTCTVPDDAPIVVSKQLISLKEYPYLNVLLDNGIKGDIYISTSYESNEDAIIIASMSASNPKMLGYMSHNFTLNRFTAEAESRVFLDMTDSERKKALSRNCTRVKVEVILPRDSQHYFNIKINNSYRGNVYAQLGQMRKLAIKDFLVKSRAGDIKIKGLVAHEEVQLETGKGNIEAQGITVSKTTKLLATGDIDAQLISTSPQLDLTVDSSDGSAKLVLMRPFWGHFKVTSSHLPELNVRRDFLWVTSRDNHTIAGFFSYNGNEPLYYPMVSVKGHTAMLEMRV
ncbi:hypothetical protein BGZ76_003509 [Entomortierella beljakovae]|nr:hypothetical protein BGZ76_003509 [Entomortierella beljakovae]